MKPGRLSHAHRAGAVGASTRSSSSATPGRRQPAWVRRLRYRFDTVLSRGPAAVIVWLGSVMLAVIALAALFLALFGVKVNGHQASFLEGFWQSLLRIIDPGTMASDDGWPLRVVALLVTLSGIFLASALIGIIATAIDRKIDDLRRGRSVVVEHDHTLVLGWSPRIFTVVSELCVANENRSDACVVVLAAREKMAMEEELRSRIGPTRGTRIVCRTGEASSLHDLAIANVAQARSIVVLGDIEDSAGDAEVVKAVLASLIANPAPEVPIVAELFDEETARALREAGGGRVLVVRAAEVIARVTAQACRQSGLSVVCQELLDFDGDEIYFAPAPELEGRTFGEALLAFESSSVIGLRRADGAVMLNPPSDTVVGPGDAVIAVSEDDDTVVFTGLRDDPVPDGMLVGTPVATEPQRILVAGWNPLGPVVLAELDAFAPPGSSADVLVDHDLIVPGSPEELGLTNITAAFLPCGGDMEELNVRVAEHLPPYDHVIILGYRNGLPPSEADARTLLTMLLLGRAHAGNGAGRVVAEILDSRDVELAQATGADDFIVSDALSSYMLAQLAENPALEAVFLDLFDARDSAIGVKPAEWYVGANGVTPYASVVAAARARGEAALGYRRAAVDGRGPEVVVNPAKSSSVHLGPGDHVVVVGPPR